MWSRHLVIYCAAVLVTGALAPATTAWAAFDSAQKPKNPAVTVLRVAPEGDQVPAPLRQLVVNFDRIMVPIGDMSVAPDKSPVQVAPAAKCHWHWLDPRSLACELDANAALTPATRYVVTIQQGLRAEDGTVLKAPYRWSFTTERPAVREFSFSNWTSPGTPIVRLVFNQPVSKDSVEALIRFGKVAIDAAPDPYERDVYYVLPIPGEKSAVVFPGGTPAVKSDDQLTQVAGQNGATIPARRVWLVSPRTELTSSSSMLLTVSPGLRSALGPLRGIESRTIVQVDTFPEFRFLGVRCQVGNAQVLLPPGSAAAKSQRCNPFRQVALEFSAPVISPEIRDHLQLTPDLRGGRTDYDPWANTYPYSSLHQPHERDGYYDVALPERLRAFQPYSIKCLAKLRDEFNRPLLGVGEMTFHTAHRVPKLAVTHPVAVLEKEAPTAVPYYVTNLTGIDIHYGTLTAKGAAHDLSSHQTIQRVWDSAYAVPANIRDLLGGESGVVTGSLFPRPKPGSVSNSADEDEEGEAEPGLPNGHPDQDFLAEVTPFQVHAKLGRYNTLVWVTRLADGKLVRDARVRLYEDTYKRLSDAPKVLAEAKTGADGVALLPGLHDLDVGPRNGYGLTADRTLMVRVDEGGDLALLPLDYPFQIDTYRASRGEIWSSPSGRDHMRAWGTTAQGVYRLGDSVDFKLYLRNVNNRTLEPVAERHGYKLQVLDPTDKVIYEKSDITLSEFGSYAGSFRIPPSAAVGWYQFQLSSPTLPDNASLISRAQSGSWQPMKVLVADFTPAPFQVRNTLNGNLYSPGDPVEVSTQATLHAGGPYASAGSRVTGRLWPGAIEPKSNAAAGFEFAATDVSGDCSSSPAPQGETVHQSEGMVDGKGELVTKFQMPGSAILSGRLELESAVRDERGKYVATRAYAEFRGRDRYVGLRSTHWTFEEGKPASVQYIVIGKDGLIAPHTPVTIEVHNQVVTAARVKGAGSAYLTAFDTHWASQATCAGESGDAPGNCAFTPSTPGLYSIVATVKDTQGREHSSELCTWVTGKGTVLWQEPEDMSLSLVPEKTAYQVGDHVHVLVRNPFPGAQALVTIERYGVIKSWVQPLEGNTPVLDFKVEPDFLPGFYLSVLVTSPRVAPAPGQSPLDKDGVDLGRPTYRIGYVKLGVQDPYKTLDVTVHTDRDTYKPRDTVHLDLKAAPHRDSSSRQPLEFAVAVLDEGVFDLIQDGQSYFDPYRGFYKLDPLDLENFGLLTRLVGLQKFEKKGANAGGDGGAGFDLRSVTKYLAYWNPSVLADGRGRAKLDFQLPDNLTGWRVFAIATTPADRLGLGQYRIKSTKLTELRPVMPNQLAEGDQFTAGFSVLNRSDQPRTIEVNLHATGPLDGGARALKQTLVLQPFKRETVWMPLLTRGHGTLRLTATAGDRKDTDGLAYTVPVNHRVSLQVAASYGTTVSEKVNEPLLFPPGMQPSIGELAVQLTPTVIGNLDGAFRYVQDYPYDCWEQRLTQALLAAEFGNLKGYLPADLKWPDAATRPQAVLDDATSFQAPNGGMTFWKPDNDRVSPYLSAATALAFNRLREAGYRIPADVEQRLHSYLDGLLRNDAAPTFYSEGMVSSVRAVALQALAERQMVKLADLKRYEKFAPQMDLFGLAAYLRAAIATPGGDALAGDLARRILSHANQSGGQFHFSEPWDDGYVQLLATPVRSECAILDAFVRYGETPAGSSLVGDVPFKLVRSLTQTRGDRDHWQNTQENLYCTQALAEYSHVYEHDAPSLNAEVKLGEESLGTAKFASFQDPAARLVRPNGAADAGQRTELRIERQGTGRIYYATHLSFAPSAPVTDAVNAGMEVHREYSVQRDGKWMLLAAPAEIHRGELVRVDLFVSLGGARHFVVVDDPVPGGLEPVNRELNTASTVDADAGAFQASSGSLWFRFGDWSEFGFEGYNFYHQELRHEAARFFADYLPAGHYHLSYAAQAIADGTFAAPPTRAAEMYDPDVYGLSLPSTLHVAGE